jgi:TDG/mug DNA glycosylase family protein
MPKKLRDVLQPNLKIVFCGMAVGKKSAELKAYYAQPGNKFWEVLYKVSSLPKKSSQQNSVLSLTMI